MRYWLLKEFYGNKNIATLYKFFTTETQIKDILIEEYGLYSQLDPQIKAYVSKFYPYYLSYYDDEWVYIKISSGG